MYRPSESLQRARINRDSDAGTRIEKRRIADSAYRCKIERSHHVSRGSFAGKGAAEETRLHEEIEGVRESEEKFETERGSYSMIRDHSRGR